MVVPRAQIVRISLVTRIPEVVQIQTAEAAFQLVRPIVGSIPARSLFPRQALLEMQAETYCMGRHLPPTIFPCKSRLASWKGRS